MQAAGITQSLALPCRRRLRRNPSSSVVRAAKRKQNESEVEYGAGWFDATRKFGKAKTTRAVLDEYRQANLRANNGKERKDLYTDNWSGDQYKGSGFNILTLLVVLFLGVPAGGLIFAYQTYGVLWG